MSKLKAIVAALALVASATPALADCTSTTSLNTLPSTGISLFGNSFSSATKSFTDCYTFTLTNSADTFGGMVEIDPLLNKLNLNIQSVALWGGSILGSLVDTTASSFDFGTLGAGNYTFAVTGDVSSAWGLYSSDVGYAGAIATVAAVPEPETYALMLLGLAGMGAYARRRKASK